MSTPPEPASPSRPSRPSPSTPPTMTAAVRRSYGSVERIEVVALDRPHCDDDRVLVEVRAAATNPLDWHLLTGTPIVARLSEGLRRPKQSILGADFAGVIAETGREVTDLSVGDRVFGESAGTFAEYATVSPENLARMPERCGFTEAAALPVAALTALQGLRDVAGVNAHQRVLVIGASGGVGTFAVQMASAMGAEVTGVCSTGNIDLVRSLGAVDVVDYTTTPVSDWPGDFDVIFDLVGAYPLRSTRTHLRRDGTYVLSGGPKSGLLGPLGPLLRLVLMNPFVPQRMRTFLAHARHDDLVAIAGMVDRGELRPVIARTFTLDQTAAAITDLARWRTRGKSVIVVKDDEAER